MAESNANPAIKDYQPATGAGVLVSDTLSNQPEGEMRGSWQGLWIA
jgi:hypothetical protein